MKITEQVEELVGETEKLIEAKIETLKLEAVEKSINFSTKLIGLVIRIGLSVMCFALLSVIGILYIATLTGGYISSSLIVLGILVLLMLLLSHYRESLLSRPIKNFLFGLYIKSKKSKTYE